MGQRVREAVAVGKASFIGILVAIGKSVGIGILGASVVVLCDVLGDVITEALAIESCIRSCGAERGVAEMSKTICICKESTP